MAKTSFKLVRKPKSPQIQKRIIREEVIRKVKPVAKAALASYEKVVANWDNKPGFKAAQTTSKYLGPWELIWNKEFLTRSEAMAQERKIKKRGIGRFLGQ